MEKYKRPRGVMEWSRCGSVEEWVWQNGALVPLQWLREYRRLVAGMDLKSEKFALTAVGMQRGNDGD